LEGFTWRVESFAWMASLGGWRVHLEGCALIPARGLVVRAFAVGRPGFDSLVESDQKTSKVGIHSFPA